MDAAPLNDATMLQDQKVIRRVGNIWRALAGAKLPSWNDLRAADLGAALPCCFTVDLSLSSGFPYFIYVGEAAAQLEALPACDAFQRELSPVELAAGSMDEAALSRAPVHHSGVVRCLDRRNLLWRSILLPLSDNGVDVSHILGAVSAKPA